MSVPVTFMAGGRTFITSVAKTPSALDAAAAQTTQRMPAGGCRPLDARHKFRRLKIHV
jgi:hypothetical protein